MSPVQWRSLPKRVRDRVPLPSVVPSDAPSRSRTQPRSQPTKEALSGPLGLLCHDCGVGVETFGQLDRHAAATAHYRFDCRGIPAETTGED